MADATLWRTKLHARLHDPIEQSLALLSNPVRDAGGASPARQRLLDSDAIPASETIPTDPDALDRIVSDRGLPATVCRTVAKAKLWAAAADVPQWPAEPVGNGRIGPMAADARVPWAEQPVLIHPLSGRTVNLRFLADHNLRDLKQRCRAHFERLVIEHDGEVDWRRTLLACWRFGSELQENDDHGLATLWPLLPAHAHVPGHSIWDHLDLTSAFAGAFTADSNGDAALLALSIGPVQGFIAAARTTSDLWAGSHLLARLSWEAAKVVCERIGPDAILFPRLRAIPQVDVWLRDECRLPKEWFGSDWTTDATDGNPLFAAALPNRFVALVPAGGARDIADAVETRVRGWLQKLGGRTVDRLLAEAGQRTKPDTRDGLVHAYRQVREQLAGLPEVHWAAVPFSLVRLRASAPQAQLDTTALSAAMAPFFGSQPGTASGFLDSPAWKLLRDDLRWDDGTPLYVPNPAILYPAVYDLAERVLAAAKAVRPFAQIAQRGWRCSLTGETEWLTTDAQQLDRPYRRQQGTLWARVAQRNPSWAKAGEHLGTLPAIKRLWPSLLVEEVAATIGSTEHIDRFVVSTHTMALARQIEKRLARERQGEPFGDELRLEFDAKADELKARPVALPRKLMASYDPDALRWIRRLPELLGTAAERNDERAQRQVENLVRRMLGVERLETYYAMLMMDGDHMGRILSGDESAGTPPLCAISYRQSLHPAARAEFENQTRGSATLRKYAEQTRALSPQRHVTISAVLNDFALTVVPQIVEREFLGRVLYAGGDDVMAMLPAADLLQAMLRLREAYRGETPADPSFNWETASRTGKLVCKDGFALLAGRLMRMMGEQATASSGAVIAHYHAPLVAVMRELRAAEQRAKHEGGRDAFSITIIKRSGGTLHLTAKWGEALTLLAHVGCFLAEPSVSRRAVYHSLVWLKDLPPDAAPDMLGSLLGLQFARQTTSIDVRKRHDLPTLGRRLANLAGTHSVGERADWLRRFLSVAEFLARETRLDPVETVDGGSPPAPVVTRSPAAH